MRDRLARAAVLGGLLALATTAAAADSGRCQAAIVIESAREVRAVARALQACKLEPPPSMRPGSSCSGRPAVGRARLRAARRAAAGIAHVCCGRDGVCGTGDDVAPAPVGWSAGFCPGLGDATYCGNAIRHPGDIAACLACTDEAAARYVTDLGFGGLPGATGVLGRCRAALGTAGADLLVARTRVLARCWAARARGSHAEDCPGPAEDAALAQAAADASARICRVCGGADQACGGAADVSPNALSYPSQCPDVNGPGGTSCAGRITTLGELLVCVTCVAAAEGDCADRIAVPAFAPDPSACHPPSAPCRAGLRCSTDADCPRGYTCTDNGGGTRYCLGPGCADDTTCRDGAVCRQYCALDGCRGRRCQCPGFACTGAGELCLGTDVLACRQLCTQDSDCLDPLGLGVCVNSGFASGLCIGSRPCF